MWASSLLAAPLLAQPLDDAAVVELEAVQLRARLADGTLSAEQVTRAFLDRIAALDDAGPTLGAVIELNPDAVAIARELDARRARGERLGALHGVPVLLKANIDTADRLATTAGSLALAGHHARADAPLVARLRAAGAVLIGKANLSEWANFRSTRSTSGWSSLGGQTRNPYVLDRSPCGSSSGSAVAVAARLVPLAVGTETHGSIVCPAGVNGVVGIKPTVGLVSRRGIIPIAASQDTAGPHARTVRDAALLLAAMQDAGARPYPLERRDLAGIRIGVVRDYLGADRYAAVEAAFARSVSLLRDAGAELVDPLEVGVGDEFSDAELEVLLFEFKAGINEYLAATLAEPRSLGALIRYNEQHAAAVMPYFGQELLEAAQRRGDLDAPAYLAAVAASNGRVRDAVARAFDRHAVDALVAPVNEPATRIDWEAGDRFELSSAGMAAISGYPSIAVPAAMADDLPLGIAFVARPYHEQLLLEVAAVFETARGAFPAPKFLPAVD